MLRPLDDKRVKQKLVAAHRDNDEIHIDPEWRHQVMRCIRNIGPLNQDKPFMFTFQEMVWRLAPVAGVLMILLAFGLFTMGTSFESGITEAFVNDPLAVVFNAILWG